MHYHALQNASIVMIVIMNTSPMIIYPSNRASHIGPLRKFLLSCIHLPLIWSPLLDKRTQFMTYIILTVYTENTTHHLSLTHVNDPIATTSIHTYVYVEQPICPTTP